MENCRSADQSLHLLQELCTREWEVLEGLIKVHGELDKVDKATRKNLKKEIDQRRKGLETLKERISHYEAQLRQEPSEGSVPGGDGQIHHGAQAEALAPVAGDAPPKIAEVPAPDPSPAEDQAQAMEVDDYTSHPSQPSPVSREDDDLLSGCLQVGRWRWSQVWPTSRFPLQEARMGRVRKPPLRRHSLSHTMLMRRHFLRVPP